LGSGRIGGGLGSLRGSIGNDRQSFEIQVMARMIGDYLLSQLLAILIDRVFLALEVHLVLGVKAQLELEVLDLEILDLAGLDWCQRRLSWRGGRGCRLLRDRRNSQQQKEQN